MANEPLRAWSVLSPLLDELLDLGEPERAARLAQIAEGDTELARRLGALLDQQAHVERQGFLEGNPLGLDGATLAGQTLGAYTLERPLGAGGMGTVWLARRSDGRYEGKVAVKLLNLALLTRGGAERFEREGSLLARLTHPNIARLLDAGVAADQPYLVIEFVEGEPIDRWCDARALDIEARVRLVLQVLAAVAHAHSKLVLHRDLKPGNILVTTDGQVKLLDFGIAKLIDDQAAPAEAGDLTQLAGRAFTPEFAAPEQVEGGDVTTATDVYALGVLLYLLLGGVHPTARPTATPLERLRAVVEVEPRRLSDAAADDPRQAGLRGAGAARRGGLLRGDLDNICAKALKKSPAERYASAAALAEDLRRALVHEPVSARPDTFAYRTVKFVRRHRTAVALASIAVIALLGGIAGTTREAIEAQRQRAAAEAQRDRAQALLGRNEAIVTFVDAMFGEAVPAEHAGAVRQMLERSEALVGTMFEGQPAHQAEILRVLARYYTGLNLPNKHHELMTRANAVVEQVPDRSLRARLNCALAVTLALLGKYGEAVAIADPWTEAADLEPEAAATCLQARAQIAQASNDAQAALRYAEAGLQRLRQAGAKAALLEATLLGDVGFAQHLSGRNRDADRAYELALERLRAIGRSTSAEAARLTVDRGLVRYAMSDFKGGLALFVEAEALSQSRGESVVPPSIFANQAFGFEQLGRYPEALAAYQRTLEAARRNGITAGEAYALIGRAAVELELGRVPAAQAALDHATTLVKTLPPAHAVRMRHTMTQARVDLARGELAHAQRGFGQIIDALSAQKVAHPALCNAHRQRAEVALQLRAPELAAVDAKRALALAHELQADHPHSDLTGLAWLTLGRVLHALGDPAAARAAFEAAVTQLQPTLGAEHPATREAQRRLAAA